MAFPDERCTSSGTRSSHRELIIGFISTQISEVPCQRHPGVLGQIKALAVIASFWSDGPPPLLSTRLLKLTLFSFVSGPVASGVLNLPLVDFKAKNKKLLQILTILVLSRVWQSSFLVRHTLTSVHIFSYFFLFFFVLSIVVPVSTICSTDSLWYMWYEFRLSLNLNLTLVFYHPLMYFVLSLLLSGGVYGRFLWCCWNNLRGVSYILSILVISKRGDKQLEQISASCREASFLLDYMFIPFTKTVFA